MARPINTSTRIGQLRSIIGLNAREYSSLAGISHGLLRRVEAGFATVSNQTIERLAYATGVDPEWLLGDGKDMCPTRLDLATGEQVPMTREDFEQRSAKNLTGSLNPILSRMNDGRLLKIRAALEAAELHGKLNAAYYVLNRTLGELTDGIASSRAEAKQMRATCEKRFAILLEADTAARKTKATRSGK
jgi:transcriptional regulator with XRE-family HTH domain